MKLTGNMILEYLSITLTSLIFGMDTRNTDAPLRIACSTYKKFVDQQYTNANQMLFTYLLWYFSYFQDYIRVYTYVMCTLGLFCFGPLYLSPLFLPCVLYVTVLEIRKLGGNLAGSWCFPRPGIEEPLIKPDLFLMLGNGDILTSCSSIISASVEPGKGEVALLPLKRYVFRN